MVCKADNLGAVHKTQTVPKYPDLRKCTGGTEKKQFRVAQKTDDTAPSAPIEEDPADLNAGPPKYESIQQKMNSAHSYVHFPGGINHNLPPPPMAPTGACPQYANTLQYPAQL